MMSAGLFDDQGRFIFEEQVFIDEKPSFYCFANETNDMTGAEVFAKYALRQSEPDLFPVISLTWTLITAVCFSMESG